MIIKEFSTLIVNGSHMRRKAVAGANKLSQTVKVTLGPSGRNVVVDPFDPANFNQYSVYPQPIVTKDGVSVARKINMLRSPM